jgi:hypothetical protein
MARALSRYGHTRCFRLGWAFERAGWVVMATIVCSAVAGLFGDGPFSSVEATAGALAARYPRFARAHAPLDVDVEWATTENEADVWIARAYLDEFEIDDVRPAPAAVTLERDRVYYTFRLSGESDRARVSFRLRPEHAGRIGGALGVGSNAEVVELRHLIFP